MGSALGFETLEEETRIDALPVEGEMPGWLHGSLLRTGPAKFEVGEQRMNHWFDGLAMLHRFGFADGRVSYANRFLESKAYRAAAETGEISYSEFATDPCRSLFKRAMALFRPALSDNCNVSLVKLGERFVAMTETPIPVEFDPDTLAAAGVAWDVPGTLTTAHPHLDRESGGMLNYAAKLGPRNHYRFFLLGPARRRSRVVASLPTREPAYMHSFGLTERWIVLAEFPYVVNPRVAGALRPPLHRELPLEAGPRHPVHADRPQRRRGARAVRGRGVLRLPPRQRLRGRGRDGGRRHQHVRRRRDRPEPLLGNLRNGAAIPPPALSRFTISPAAGTVAGERLIDDPIDLPRIDYGRCNERPYRYVWGVGTDGTGFFDRIVAVDLEQRTQHDLERARLLAGRAGIRQPRPARPTRGTACCSRSCSTVRRGRRSCSSSTRRPSARSAGPGCPTTSRSASTASTPPRLEARGA